MTSRIFKAYYFARDQHAKLNQRRKYSGERYIYHPVEVAKMVKSIGGDEDMIIASLLHDTKEDTDATLEQIEALFGRRVMILVEMLTDVSQPTDGNRAVRKEIDRQHTARASGEAKTIKLADLISNVTSIVAEDPDFARVYLKEKTKLLEVLTEGHPRLYQHAVTLVAQSKQELGLRS